MTVIFAVSAGVASAKEPGRIDYNRQIRPILAANCFACHGPDEHAREAELRLDVQAEAYQAEAIVPGQPAESELVARITSEDADLMMPPPDSKKTLNPQQVELLRRWSATRRQIRRALGIPSSTTP